MSLFGTLVTVLIGPGLPLLATPDLLEALESIEVDHSEEGPSALQLNFKPGRALTDVLDDPLVADPRLKPFSRVVISVVFGAMPQVLFDGVITYRRFTPGEPGQAGTFTVTGEELSVLMELDERSEEYPAQTEMVIANLILARYATQGVVPMVIPPPVVDTPLPTERIPVQRCSDKAYLKQMARRFGYVFHMEPGPAPGVTTAYWGPPKRVGVPQKALSVNLGADTNVNTISFNHSGLEAGSVSGHIQDRTTGQQAPVETFATTRMPLSSSPGWRTQPMMRTRQHRSSGVNLLQAYARAQGEMDATMDRVAGATGELDALTYEALLSPRKLVGVRGAGYSNDGLYYVKQVRHRIQVGRYTQSFTLSRDGEGSTLPALPT